MLNRLFSRLYQDLSSRDLLKSLAKLETGVFVYCNRLSYRAKRDQMPALARELWGQSLIEYRHAKAFGKMAGLDIPEHLSDYLAAHPSHATINTGSAQRFQADGLSKASRLARVFFGDRSASDYGWSDQLAFMALLENLQARFYAYAADEEEKKGNHLAAGLLRRIALDEQLHSSKLAQLEFQQTGLLCWLYRIKWVLRLVWAFYKTKGDRKS